MKITKDQIKMLKDIAAKLPKMYTADKHREYAYKLGKVLVSPVQGEGKPINHFLKLVRIYKTSEKAGAIGAYIHEVIKINVDHGKAVKEKNERIKMLMS